ncbi:hypothetical protein EPO34_03275 [Patescibacteria group bacterium]|nr:MAG: hypothetical protein EPO34_03275 [Patescibacteria group bacterium]
MSAICNGASCTVAEVGRFMAGISKACGNEGNCQLPDIMQVIVNIGNFVLGLVGAVVFLMYVIGGFWFIFAHGNMEYVKKGKTMMTTATVGLFIVFFAFAGIQTLKSVLSGTTAVQKGGKYVLCTGTATEDQACALNSTCKGFVCTSTCDADHPNGDFLCADKNDPFTAQRITSECEPKKCPGGDAVQCCRLKK